LGKQTDTHFPLLPDFAVCNRFSPRFQHGFEVGVQEVDAGTKDEEEQQQQQQQQFFCCFVQKNIGLEEEVTTASLLASTHFSVCVPTLYTPHCTDQCRQTDRVYIWEPAHSLWSSNLQRSVLCVLLSYPSCCRLQERGLQRPPQEKEEQEQHPVCYQ